MDKNYSLTNSFGQAKNLIVGKIKKTFLPYNYDQLMFQQLQNFRQGSRSVDEYRARFVGGLRQQIQHTLNFFNPITIVEAHQQALIVESQTKVNFFLGVHPASLVLLLR